MCDGVRRFHFLLSCHPMQIGSAQNSFWDALRCSQNRLPIISRNRAKDSGTLVRYESWSAGQMGGKEEDWQGGCSAPPPLIPCTVSTSICRTQQSSLGLRRNTRIPPTDVFKSHASPAKIPCKPNYLVCCHFSTKLYQTEFSFSSDLGCIF